MKKILEAIGITILKFFANFIYLFLKCMPTKNRIVMISRQSNNITLDFSLLRDKINELYNNVELKILCHKLEEGIKNKIKYCFYILKIMYYLATSKVCVLDGYCIPASILKHKKKLKIIQIWHASGAIKKFGYQILDKKEGSNSEIAKLMCMHKNYNYIIAPSKITGEIFAEAFNTPIEKVVQLGLPRLEYIVNKKYDLTEQIYKEYPKLKSKENILYIPTFRKDNKINLVEELLKAEIDKEKYNLIISLHPLDDTIVPEEYLIDKKYSSFDLIKIADYIITDYSALSIEASLLEKPVFLYVPDYEEYVKNRGLNISFDKELKTFTSKKISDIMTKIEKKDYDMKELIAYKNKYINVDSSTSISDLSRYLLKIVGSNNL